MRCEYCGELVDSNPISASSSPRPVTSPAQLMIPLSSDAASIAQLGPESLHPHRTTADENTATVLCIFFGLFGIHRFFLGHLTSGVIQFALGAGSIAAVIAGTFALLMPALIWLVSDVYLLVGGYMRRSNTQPY